MSDSFMKPVVFDDSYYAIETTNGTEFIPSSVVGNPKTIADFEDYLSGEPNSPELPEPIEGWVCQMSASGYLDCTNWVGFPTELDCWEFLLETYGSGWEQKAFERIKELMETNVSD